MKVLFWMSTSFQTTSRHLLISVLDEMQKAGHQITVLKKITDGETEELPLELSNRGIKCISVPLEKTKKNNFVKRYLKDIEYILKCNSFLNDRYDAVFVQSTNVAGFVFYMLQKKQKSAIKTLNVQDAFPDNTVFSSIISENSLLYKALRVLQAYAYRKADHIITISEDIKDLLCCYMIPSEKIEVVYNWSYQDAAFYTESKDSNDIAGIFDKNKFHVVYAGNVGVMQNVDLLIDAADKAKNNKDLQFDIIGEGTQREKLKKRANELGLKNVYFYPLQPSHVMPAIYCSADVNIVPLRKNIYKTALPSKTAICLASQSPIIFALGRDSSFGKWISSETNCPLIDSDDADGLIKAILSIKNGSTVCTTKYIYQKNFLKTVNSKKYVNIITEAKDESDKHADNK